MKFCIENVGLMDVRPKLTDFMEETHEGVRFAIKKYGTPVAGLVNFSDLRVLKALTRISASDIARIQPLVSKKKRAALGIIIGWLDSHDLNDDT